MSPGAAFNPPCPSTALINLPLLNAEQPRAQHHIILSMRRLGRVLLRDRRNRRCSHPWSVTTPHIRNNFPASRQKTYTSALATSVKRKKRSRRARANREQPLSSQTYPSSVAKSRINAPSVAQCPHSRAPRARIAVHHRSTTTPESPRARLLGVQRCGSKPLDAKANVPSRRDASRASR
jgi:hypothetical protein